MTTIVSASRLVGSNRARVTRSVPSTPVVLITPPSVFLLDERVFMSLGILKVAAVLEQAGCSVELLDLSGIENFVDVVDLHIRSSTACAVALTTTPPQLPAAVKIAERILAGPPHARII